MDPSCQTAPGEDPSPTQPPQLAVLDFFFPGFSMLSGAIQKYLHIDLNLYIPLILLLGGLAVSWRYFSEYFWDQLETHFMSHVDCPTNDDSYNFLMNWVAGQSFAKRARRFMVNTNLNSRSWFVWSWESEDDEDAEYDDPNEQQRKKKALQYTPTFGSHYFWYRGRLLIFRRTQSQNRSGFVSASEKEEISVSCFGRNPWVLKELLLEARTDYLKKDESKTLIYRGTTRSGSTDPTWQRCMARSSRPLSTVILNDKVKTELIDDVTDYLNPATRRWYANRGIPYRRGYLLHRPPGTGKSSLSLALAGFFKMRIYIVSLNSITANEENLASLFAELPRRCVVLLEDIDTAGLTHTREDGKPAPVDTSPGDDMVPGQVTPGNSSATNNDGNNNNNNNNNNGNNNPVNGRLSLSGLLNILDGVASQEGRVLVMTTNHLEKLDKALIRPGRVDMIVKFDLADRGMTTSIFRAIFAPLEGDDEIPVSSDNKRPFDPEADQQKEAEAAKKKDEIIARVNRLADEFADKIPAHEFSPAELQGYLLKNKRNAETAVENADQWVIDTRKEKKEKLLKEAEERRKKEEEEAKKKEEEEKKKKEEEEKKKKEEEEKKKKEEEEKRKKEEEDKKKEAKKQRRDKSRRRKGRKGRRSSDSERDSSSESDSESDAEEKEKRQKRNHGSEEGKSRKAEPKAEPEAKERQDTRQAETTITVDEADGKTTAVKELAEEGKHGGDSGYGTP